jgi:hypothetical protein
VYLTKDTGKYCPPQQGEVWGRLVWELSLGFSVWQQIHQGRNKLRIFFRPWRAPIPQLFYSMSTSSDYTPGFFRIFSTWLNLQPPAWVAALFLPAFWKFKLLCRNSISISPVSTTHRDTFGLKWFGICCICEHNATKLKSSVSSLTCILNALLGFLLESKKRYGTLILFL